MAVDTLRIIRGISVVGISRPAHRARDPGAVLEVFRINPLVAGAEGTGKGRRLIGIGMAALTSFSLLILVTVRGNRKTVIKGCVLPVAGRVMTGLAHRPKPRGFVGGIRRGVVIIQVTVYTTRRNPRMIENGPFPGFRT